MSPGTSRLSRACQLTAPPRQSKVGCSSSRYWRWSLRFRPVRCFAPFVQRHRHSRRKYALTQVVASCSVLLSPSAAVNTSAETPGAQDEKCNAYRCERLTQPNSTCVRPQHHDAHVSFSFFFGGCFRLVFYRISAKVQTALAEAGSVAEQSLSLVRVVRAHANEEHERRRSANVLLFFGFLSPHPSHWFFPRKFRT